MDTNKKLSKYISTPCNRNGWNRVKTIPLVLVKDNVSGGRVASRFSSFLGVFQRSCANSKGRARVAAVAQFEPAEGPESSYRGRVGFQKVENELSNEKVATHAKIARLGCSADGDFLADEPANYSRFLFANITARFFFPSRSNGSMKWVNALSNTTELRCQVNLG